MQSSLGSRVRVRLQRRYTNAVDGANVNDTGGVVPGSVAIFSRRERGEHEGDEALREREHSLEVEREDLGECAVGVRLDRSSPIRSSVVDQNIEVLLLLRELRDDVIHPRLRREIRRNPSATTFPNSVQFLRRLLQVLRGPPGDVDMRSRRDVLARNHPPNPCSNGFSFRRPGTRISASALRTLSSSRDEHNAVRNVKQAHRCVSW